MGYREYDPDHDERFDDWCRDQDADNHEELQEENERLRSELEELQQDFDGETTYGHYDWVDSWYATDDKPDQVCMRTIETMGCDEARAALLAIVKEVLRNVDRPSSEVFLSVTDAMRAHDLWPHRTEPKKEN